MTILRQFGVELVRWMKARAILEAEISTVVFHMQDHSTDFLTPIYAGRNYQVITGAVKQDEARSLIKAHARVFMLGHGGPGGLFTRGFYADDSIGPLLAEKQDGLYIWCNADAYAHRNKLTGLVSGMFISEVGEARMFGITATQAEVDASNNAFSKAVRQALDSGAAHSTVRDCYSSASCAITKFNNERLYVFEQGQASPALHKTSMAHSYGRPRPADTEPDKAGPKADELLALIAYVVDAVLANEATPEEAAEEILRHTDAAADSAYDYIVRVIKMGLAQGEDVDSAMLTQQVADGIFG